MAKQDKDNGFPAKFEKKLPTGFKEDADSFDLEKLKQTILECESNIVTVDREMQNDDKLQGVKDLLKDLSSAYRDAKHSQTAKIKYCLHLLESKGYSLESGS
jgi:hypothetical protein